MALNCISLVGKSEAGNFFADGASGRWRTTRTLNVVGYGNPPTPTTSGHLETITINGTNFGTGRIVSVRKGAGAGFGQRGLDTGVQQFDATVEIFVDGNTSLTNFSTSTITNLKYIDSFSEELSSSVGENGDFRFTHNVRVKMLKHSGAFDAIDAAQDIAEAIYNGTNYDTAIPTLGQNIAYNRAGRKFYSESYNTKTLECNFTKTYILSQKNPSTNYTVNVTTKFTVNEAGNLDVTESAEILGLNDYSSLLSALTTELGGAYTRSLNLFYQLRGYVFGSDETLFAHPVSLTKSIDIGAERANYSVVYSNNKSLDLSSAYFIEETRTRNRDSDITTICYDGQIRSFSKKRTGFDGVTIYNDRLSAISGSSDVTGYTLKNKSANITKYGKDVSYQVCFTNDPAISTSGTFRKMEVSVTDTPAQVFHREYTIPNSGQKVSRGHNVDLSTRTVTINATIPRTNETNVFYTIPNIFTYLNAIKSTLITKCIAVFTELNLTSRNPILDASFFSNNTASINSNREISVTLEYKYIIKKTNLNDKIF